MKIGGWKTRSVFGRYAIVSQTDIRDAMTSLYRQSSKSDNAEAAAQQKVRGVRGKKSSGKVRARLGRIYPKMVPQNSVDLAL